MLSLLIVALVGGIASLIITPVVIQLALRVGLVDHPDGFRKLHDRSVPLGGGLVILAALLIAILIGVAIVNPVDDEIASRVDPGFYLGLIGACTLIVIVGLIDDRIGLRGRHKLLGQTAAVLLLISSGLVVREVSVLGWNFELGMFAIPLTCFWLLGAINALNLLDGVDGLAASVGVILTVTTGLLSLYTLQSETALIAFALTGALLGFLPFNFSPARIFLGDAGSMLIGLVAGALAIQGSFKEATTAALAAPLAVWAIPILDTVAAIMRRKLTARSIFTTDRSHLHHCLLSLFGSKAVTVAVISACCVLTCAGAVLSVYLETDLVAFVAAGGVVGMLVASRVFGYVELMHLGRRMRTISQFWLTPPSDSGSGSVHSTASPEWDTVWSALIESAEKFNLELIRLHVTIPKVGEDFHANWHRPSNSDSDVLWRTELPIFSGDETVGRLIVAGKRDYGATTEHLERLMQLLQSIELQIMDLVARSTESGVPDVQRPVPESVSLPELAEERISMKDALSSSTDS